MKLGSLELQGHVRYLDKVVACQSPGTQSEHFDSLTAVLLKYPEIVHGQRECQMSQVTCNVVGSTSRGIGTRRLVIHVELNLRFVATEANVPAGPAG